MVHPTGAIKERIRRLPIAQFVFAETGSELTALEEVYARFGSANDILLELADPAAFDALCTLSHQPERLWLCTTDIDDLVRWRDAAPDLRLVHSTQLDHMPRGPEHLAATLSAADIDAVCLPYANWTGGLTTLFHRFDVLCVGRGAVHARMFDALLHMGIDGIRSPHVERMLDALGRA